MLEKSDELKCHKCGRKAEPVKVKFQHYDISGWRCRKCGEEYLNPEQAQCILFLNKLKKNGIGVKVGRIRSNLIIRIPKTVEQTLQLKQGEEVKLKVLDQHSFKISA
ncbi:MAG: AbrB/MazE/SpoVT family DNA-binding domain-containing protein [Candidatus Micrarchaeota archaeon]